MKISGKCLRCAISSMTTQELSHAHTCMTHGCTSKWVCRRELEAGAKWECANADTICAQCYQAAADAMPSTQRAVQWPSIRNMK